MHHAQRPLAYLFRHSDFTDYALVAVAAILCAVAAAVPGASRLVGACNIITVLTVTSATVALIGFLLPLADCLRGS
jgi:hypothetical protein